MHDTSDSRPPYLWAFATFAVVFIVYFLTLSPSTALWDTSEYIAAAKVLGIPHPPGNPLFTLMAHVWGSIPWAEDYAKRINLFAAFTSAASAGIWFLVAERWIRNVLADRSLRLAAVFAGIFSSACAWTVWSQSTVNEKVYTVSLLSIAIAVWCMVRWADEPVGGRRNRWLVLAVYITALSSTNHMMGSLGLPIIGLYILLTEWRLLLKPWVLLTGWLLMLSLTPILGEIMSALFRGSLLSNNGKVGLGGVVALAALALVIDRKVPWLYLGVGAVLLGVSVNFLYLPMRAAQFPALNEGEPIGFFSQALNDVLNRVQYLKPPVSFRMSTLSAQFSMYLQYWGWQWGRDLGGLAMGATALFSALGFAGLVSLIKRDRRAGFAAGTLFVTLTVLLIIYLNFKYGFSYHPEDRSIVSEMREVRERDYFFLASFAFTGVLIAAGFAAAIRAASNWLGDRSNERTRWLVAVPVLALALIPLIGNRETAPRNKETIARDFAIDVLQSVEPYGILITAGDNDTFPLWFAQEVLHVRRDVTLANLSLMGTDWHLRQIKNRVADEFDPARSIPMWHPGTDSGATTLGAARGGWPRPTTPVFPETTGWLDSIPAGMLLGGHRVVEIGKLSISFGHDTVTRSDLAAGIIIRDNIGKRPIYFSLSDQNYPDDVLGLHNYLVGTGFVRKLMPEPVKVGGEIVDSQYLGFVDIDKTRSLMFDTYHAESAARDRPRGWPDPPSVNILALYVQVYGAMAPVLAENGDSVHASQANSIALRVQKSFDMK